MITKWSIENFKSFRHRTEIELGPVTVFAGANSSGKSTIIQSILVLKQTIQYSPATRAMALNGPLLKLGRFSDVKNVSSDQSFIGIGWEIQLEDERVGFRANYSSLLQTTRYWGRSTINSVGGNFTWEVPPGEEIGPSSIGSSQALLQLQPKLRSSQLNVSLAGDENTASRLLALKQIGTPHLQTPDADFGYAVSQIDPLSSQELLAAKPDGEIVAAAPRHFFPGQIAVKYDGAKERAFRVAAALCSEESYRFRTPQMGTIKIPFEVIKLFQDRFLAEEEHQYPVLALTPNEPVTLDQLSEAILFSSSRLESLKLRRGQIYKFNLLDLRPQVQKILFDKFIDDSDVQREAIELSSPRYVAEAGDRVSAYFISAVRYLGPLRDEPKPIYPLEALVNPTEVGYRGEHTAAVLVPTFLGT